MLRIYSLLNPTAVDSLLETPSATPPLTPAYTNQGSSPPSPGPGSTPANGRQKMTKDAAVFVHGTANGPVHYAPFECNDPSTLLSKGDQAELRHQHQRFEVSPSGNDDKGLISHVVRHIPYSSEKKTFSDKTGRDGFVIYQYNFKVPKDPDGRQQTVMWDYEIGLVRITPFFKACNYSKTTPGKALGNNPGLKELCHSITGGAIAAQGYWMPYSCARALCITFCYPIRWALTPIFGPSFIKECLKPDHPGFAKFKIDREIVKLAAVEAAKWKSSSRSATPDEPSRKKATLPVPRSVPDPEPEIEVVGTRALRPRPAKGTFKPGSPFDDDYDSTAEIDDIYDSAEEDSPPLSPKSAPAAPPLNRDRAWTPINQGPSSSSPSNYATDRRGVHPSSLRTQPHSQQTSWRAADVEARTPRTVPASAGSRGKRPESNKRRNSSLEDGYGLLRDRSYVSSSSESDDADLVIVAGARKRQRREEPSESADLDQPSVASLSHPARSVRFTPEEARAARWLLNLSFRDSQLAAARHAVADGKKRVSAS